MIISTEKNEANNALILRSMHRDFVSSTGAFLYGGVMITASELPQSEYTSVVKKAYRKKQQKVVAQFIAKHLQAELGNDAKRYVENEMNQWLDSKQSILKHFEAFGRAVPPSLIKAFKTETIVFPDDLVFFTTTL
jgi:hypothetical protein